MSASRDVRLCYWTVTKGWVPVKQGLDSLSRRELEFLKMMASGLLVTEIAKKLFLSYKTVSTYRKRVCEKLELTTDTELIHYALYHGVVKNMHELKKPKSKIVNFPRSRPITQSNRRFYAMR